ncbi:MAG TPA: hypothetical protein VFT45_03245 [Longimicrobium sp.]|nr:hypothetical protein [Longimicrobium sp.]
MDGNKYRPDGKIPIVAEVHRVRQEILTEFNGDMDAYHRHLKKIEEDGRKKGRIVIDRSARTRSRPDAA